MKLHFSNVNFSSNSGPNSFATRLADVLVNRGHQIVDHNQDYDIFLCFIEPASIPRADAKFIQRLDGIWFKPDQYETHNKRIKWAYDNSHHVIWQSNFDKNMTEKWWGSKPGSVIHNGIKIQNVGVSQSLLELKQKYKRIFSCSANWHSQKRLKDNINLFQKIANNNDVLIVLGSNPDYVINDPRIMYAGTQPHDVCLQIYAISDWFIHLAWLDHCPNVVVEALSQKCPVICTDSGGTKEIVREYGIIIPEKHQYHYELTDYSLPPQIDCNIDQLPKIEVNPEHVNIEIVADKYEMLFSGKE